MLKRCVFIFHLLLFMSEEFWETDCIRIPRGKGHLNNNSFPRLLDSGNVYSSRKGLNVPRPGTGLGQNQLIMKPRETRFDASPSLIWSRIPSDNLFNPTSAQRGPWLLTGQQQDGSKSCKLQQGNRSVGRF